MTSSRTNINFYTTFLLFFSLFFNTDSNVYLFYLSFLLTVSVLLYQITELRIIKVESSLWWYMLFIVWSALSFFWARETHFVVSMIFRLAVVTICLLYCMNQGENFVYAASCGLIFGIIVNLPLIPVSEFYVLGRFSGTTSNSNHLGLLCCFGILALTINKHLFSRYLLLAIWFGSLIIISLTNSRKFLLIIMATFIIFFLGAADKKITNKYSILTGFILLLVVAVILLNIDVLAEHFSFLQRFDEMKNMDVTDLSREGFGGDASTRWRLQFITWAFEIFKDYPFTGIGLDNFKTVYNEKFYSHNNYVELLSTLGLLGFILYYRFIYSFIHPFLKSGKLLLVVIAVFLLAMDFAMVTYFERMYILPMYLLFRAVKGSLS